MTDVSDRIEWLKTILKTYEEDEKTFGLTASDTSRVNIWKAELHHLELTAKGVTE